MVKSLALSEGLRRPRTPRHASRAPDFAGALRLRGSLAVAHRASWWLRARYDRLRYLRVALGIGVSHPARSAGFIPFTKPPNANVDG